ncbi:hypothetical protein F8O05_14640 [Gulosibacter chungangensis]|uniref:Acyltransferase 3 domain-containing protein n=1 Tax=Gulosibacter chungangensis TaxID=979746 RepID=A0A7J5B7A9_9MICO|nr:acyltransferase family protein [Gulosibacter chungangensis]KAB1640402.1 hypothetical protein F8O05_14640 [Gulosibacter chungangensis]
MTATIFVLDPIPSDWSLYSINGAIRLLPFFLLGIGLYRFQSIARGPLAPFALVLAGTGLTAIKTIVLNEANTVVSRLLAVLLATFVLAALLRFKNSLTWKPLAWLGQFSYGVYLLHVFGTAGTRLLLDRLGIGNDFMQFFISLAVGIALPVAFELLFCRNRWIMLLVLGQRAKPRENYNSLLRRTTTSAHRG